jgi:hypothetical protein
LSTQSGNIQIRQQWAASISHNKRLFVTPASEYRKQYSANMQTVQNESKYCNRVQKHRLHSAFFMSTSPSPPQHEAPKQAGTRPCSAANKQVAIDCGLQLAAVPVVMSSHKHLFRPDGTTSLSRTRNTS